MKRSRCARSISYGIQWRITPRFLWPTAPRNSRIKILELDRLAPALKILHKDDFQKRVCLPLLAFPNRSRDSCLPSKFAKSKLVTIFRNGLSRTEMPARGEQAGRKPPSPEQARQQSVGFSDRNGQPRSSPSKKEPSPAEKSSSRSDRRNQRTRPWTEEIVTTAPLTFPVTNEATASVQPQNVPI